MDHPEGASSHRADRVDFDPRVRLDRNRPVSLPCRTESWSDNVRFG